MITGSIHNRRRAVVVLLALVAVLTGSVTWWFMRLPSDERRYRQLLREFNWDHRLESAEAKNPALIAKAIPFGTLRAMLDSRHESTIDDLVKTGYFTNALLPILDLEPSLTNENLIMDEVRRRFANHRLSPPIGFMSCWVVGTNFRITCRSEDLERVKAAVERR